MRASFFGVSAAMGKLGALLGGAILAPLAHADEMSIIFFVCAALSAGGILITAVLIEPFGRAVFCPPSTSRRTIMGPIMLMICAFPFVVVVVVLVVDDID